LANSREKVVGSLLSCDQVIVTEPPEEGFWEVTCRLDSAEAKGRKKRTLRTRAGCIRLY